MAIAKRLPSECAQFMEPIWKHCSKIIALKFNAKSISAINEQRQQRTDGKVDIMQLSGGPIGYLFEFVICVSNGLQSMQKRSAAISELMKDVVAAVNGKEIQSIFDDEERFAKMIQFPISKKQVICVFGGDAVP